ncbi:threonine ammonia-lyase IlvA [uncultured Corynebacterium sp.]|uniref:threonine ammonia-lyase IlvA n=1 Tax=uncultured Corynebacterium sp. TaxID=159447 RepID=UPI0026321B3C|nr:threonine ammonia-lyase IlvA [uncultured Corynebacterium sp.]
MDNELTDWQSVTAAEIQHAQSRISAVIAPTPLQYCPRLSEQVGAEVYLKREDLQDVRSYKIRGAYNSIVQLTEEERAAGIVAASAGNHAQGVAYACRSLNIHGRIFVPAPTPKQKLNRIKVHGGESVEVVLTGKNFDEAAAAARAYVEESGATMIEPFNARNTVIGQGTVAAEIVSQLSSKGKTADNVFVPVGGGGLLGGTLSYLASMSPETKVIGVEPQTAASMQAALAKGGPVTVDGIDPFVDGAAVARVGEVNFAIAKENWDRLAMQSANEGAVCTELLELYQNEGIIAEPAGALSVTGLVEFGDIAPGSVNVCIISGGNNDVLRYSEIVERDLVQRGLKHYFLVKFPQEPGQLRGFLTDILGEDDDIARFEYLKKNNRDLGTALVGIELDKSENLEPLLTRMRESSLSIQYLRPGTPEYDFLF